MVKVIKYGKKRRIMCGECESILEFKEEDVDIVRTGRNEYEKHIQCPVCNHNLTIPLEM